MTLKELYGNLQVPLKKQIKFEKKILFVVPTYDFDFSEYLKVLELSKYDVCYTCRKSDDDNDSIELILEEIKAIKPNIVIQIGYKPSRRYDYLESIEDITEDLKNRVFNAIPEIFVNLHHHDEYSIRDGLGTVDMQIELITAMGGSFCSVTNHGHVGGWIKQRNACKKAGILPLHGCEGYFNDFRVDKEESSKVVEKFDKEIEKLNLAHKSINLTKPSQEQRDELKANGYKTLKDMKVILKERKLKAKEILDIKKAEKKEHVDKEKEEAKENRKNNHLLLIAKNRTGYYNIIKMMNDANLNGFYYSPRINWEAVEKWGSGIIATSACWSGLIPQLLIAEDEKGAIEVYNRYNNAFDEFYIELSMIEMEDQVGLNNKLIQFAQKVDAKLIVALDSHYVKAEHCETHDILMLIKEHKTIFDAQQEDSKVWQFEARNLYCRSTEELKDLWEDGFYVEEVDDKGISTGMRQVRYKSDIFTEEVFNEAVLNTRRIALSVEDIKLDTSWKLPKLSNDGAKILKDKCEQGFKDRGLRGKVYSDRLDFELGVICDMGFADYFLTMEIIISDAKNEWGELAVAWGRGCFHPAMRVKMGSGMYKFISDVKKGDIVVSHDNSRQKVLDVYEYGVTEELLEIETDDGRKIKCTPDHEIMVTIDNCEKWIEAKDLSEGMDIKEIS